MITVDDIKNPTRQSGFDRVHYSAPQNGPRPCKPYQAIACDGPGPRMDKAGRRWRGPRRATAVESAQDYCDYHNGFVVSQPTRLNTAGHVRVRPERLPQTAQPRTAPQTTQGPIAGYVYLITDGTAGKVGKTANHPSNRVADLQTGNPRLLRLLAIIETDDIVKTERELHAKFAHLSLLGEWFSFDPIIFIAFGLDPEFTVSV